MKAIYTVPKLCKSASAWYVHFRFNGKQYRYKQGINTIVCLKQRELEAGFLASALHESLCSGWNPELPHEKPPNTENKITLLEGLDFAYDKKKGNLAHKTQLDYACALRVFKTIIPELGLDSIPAAAVKKFHIKLILEKAQKIKTWSNHSYNKNRTYLQSILSELVEWEIIEHNPASKIKKLPVGESTLHRPPNKTEFTMIIEALNGHPAFKIFCMTIFFTLCREVEILRLRIGMIDLEQRTITLPKEITKSRKKGRVVLINDFLYAYLAAMNLQDYPKDFFVFGKHADKRMGQYIPAPFEIHRNRATELWRAIVKDGLGLNVTLYANKAAGVDALLLAGAPIETVSGGCGHSDVDTTKIYASVLGQKQREQLNNFARDYGDV